MNPPCLIGTIRDELDLLHIRVWVDPIKGLPAWRADFLYPDGLALELGSTVPAEGLGMTERGEWSLATDACDWRLTRNQEVLVSSWEIDGKDDLLRTLFAERPLVTGLEVSYPALGLRVSFSNGLVLSILPDRDEDELAYWEVARPDGMLLEVGPDLTWSVTPGNWPIFHASALKSLQQSNGVEMEPGKVWEIGKDLSRDELLEVVLQKFPHLRRGAFES